MPPDSAAPGLLQSGLFRRLLVGYVTVIVVVTAVVGLLIQAWARGTLLRDAYAQLEAEAVHLAELARPALAAGSLDAELQGRLRQIGAQTGSRLTVLAPDGTVLADSSQDPATMDNHGGRDEVVQALEHGLGRSERFSNTRGTDLIYLALRVPRSPGEGPLEGPVQGVVRTSITSAQVERSLAELRGMVLGGAGVAGLTGLLIGLLFARRLTVAVQAVTETVESISRGGYTHVPGGGSGDELGRLAGSVNRMSDQLRERLETIDADRNKLLAILGSMVEGVIAVDREEQVVHMNAVAGRMLGLVPSQCLGRRIWEVTRVPEIPAILERTRDDDESAGRAELRREGTQDPLVLELAASPLLDASGRRAGAVVVLHDVTDLRRLEQVRQDFVANVSHELKTPLTAIRGLVETLIDDEDMDPAIARRFAVKIRDQSQRLATLVSDLLTLARIESTRAKDEPAPIDARGLVRECAGPIAALCADKRVELTVELPEAPVLVDALDEDLRQIVGNLLDNAVKYTPAEGRVDLRVRQDRSGTVIEVSDTGIGIEPSEQDRIFERFYRVDRARSRDLGGTGLGLAIGKHLVLSLGGAIEVQSTPGAGSTFRVTLPPSLASV